MKEPGGANGVAHHLVVSGFLVPLSVLSFYFVMLSLSKHKLKRMPLLPGLNRSFCFHWEETGLPLDLILRGECPVGIR